MSTTEEIVRLNPEDWDKPWHCGTVNDWGQDGPDLWDGWVFVQDAPFSELVVSGVTHDEAVVAVRETWKARRVQ